MQSRLKSLKKKKPFDERKEELNQRIDYKTESSCFRVTFDPFYLNKMNLTVTFFSLTSRKFEKNLY